MPKEVGFSFLKVNLMSILILLVYAVNVKFMGNDDSGDVEEEVYISLSVRQIAVRFICYSVGLVIASILLTTVTDRLGGGAAGGYGCRGNLPGSGYLTAGAECFCQSGTDWKFQRILR